MTKRFDALFEKYFETRKPVDGYVEMEELLGKKVWVHTNRTHRNQGYNGMIGIYGVNSKGFRTGSPLHYTNEIQLKGPIVFEASESGSDRIHETGKRTLVAGVSGVVENISPDANSWEQVDYSPEVKHFFKVSDPERKKVTSASKVYFNADETGKYKMLAQNPITE